MKQLFPRGEGNGQRRVLLADEVGLGKTIVAKTVIRELTKLRSAQGEKTTVLYLCSSTDLSKQNGEKLGKLVPHRITELSIHPLRHTSGEPAIISASTKTSVKFKKTLGRKNERAIVYVLCCKVFQISYDHADFRYFLSNGVQHFDKLVENARHSLENKHGDSIAATFADGLLEHRGCDRTTLLQEATKLVRTGTNKRKQREIMGCMLQEMVKSGMLHTPELSLIILDEFQRFEDVLADSTVPDSISHLLLSKSKVPVLLLSATPFKMLTSSWDEGAQHDQQMIQLLEFLYGGGAGNKRVDEIKNLFYSYRLHLLDAAAGRGDHYDRIRVKQELEHLIGSVIVRTERRALSGALMEPKERSISANGLDVKDIQHYFMLRQANIEGFNAAAMTFWQSSPYVLSYCDKEYKFKQKFLESGTSVHKNLAKPQFRSLRRHMILSKSVKNPKMKLTITHPRMKALINRSLKDQRSAQWVWMPPSKPYWKPQGAYVNTGNELPSKLLVFSNWRFVPRAISTLLSMEAERELYKKWEKPVRNHRAMNISTDNGGTHFTVLYPSMFLAEAVSPLEIVAKAAKKSSADLRWSEMKAEAVRLIKRRLKSLDVVITKTKPMPIHRVYQLLIRLDAKLDYHGTVYALHGMIDYPEWNEENRSLIIWKDRLIEELPVGSPLSISEKDVEQLAVISLASPATTLLRSLRDHYPQIKAPLHRKVVSFCMYTLRSFLTKPHVFSIIKQTEGQKYWDDILTYGIQGNIQAMWDEYIALLSTEESELVDVLTTLQKVLGFSARELNADGFLDNGEVETIKLPTGYCLPFSDEQKDETTDVKVKIRKAFNSPFWPYVLVTTSVGQEGLDFHRYCRELVHWNLPVNPIDFEQREGRINRYRSLAVRQAVGEEIKWAEALNMDSLGRAWELLFRAAAERMPVDGKRSDLWPDWVFYGSNEDGKSRLIRHVWLFPFSKEHFRYRKMRELVVLYRLAFGQPNQDDFLKELQLRISHSGLDHVELTKRYMIDLAPK